MEFFSTGFQEIFADLDENKREKWDFYPSSSSSSMDSNIPLSEYCYDQPFQIKSECNYHCDYYSYVDNIHSFDMDTLFSTTENDLLINNYSMIDSTLYNNECTDSLNCFQLTTTNPVTTINMNNDWNYWEEKFLENYIEVPEIKDENSFKLSSNSLLISDKTPLCSDSCNSFLKESTDNLNKYRLKSIEKSLKNRRCTKNKNLTPNKSMTKIKVGINDIQQQTTFSCTWENCNKIYAKPAHLKAHLRRHLGDKPYVCNWPDCTWKFSRSDELARHKRSHSGIKPFCCIYCPKCFARSDHLSKHRKVHERKMAASKGVYIPNLHQVRPGRKPKNLKNLL